MGSSSDIEWTDATWTPIRARNKKTGKVGWHCEHATDGCKFCFSEGINLRLGTGLPFKPGHRKDIEVFLDETMLLAPLAWRGPRMVFVCSMTDLFADFVPDEWIDRLFAVMALCPQHTFQVLTKRSARMLKYFSAQRQGKIIDAHGDMGIPFFDWPLPNVWLGVSAERQQEADERIPDLIETPANVHFLSLEPLLGPIDFSKVPGFNRTNLSLYRWWVIVGGESDARRQPIRPMHPDWVRSIRDQCNTARVPIFFKQWGGWQPFQPPMIYDASWERSGNWVVATNGALSAGDKLEGGPDKHPRWCRTRRLSKADAGRELDGREWSEMPAPAAAAREAVPA